MTNADDKLRGVDDPRLAIHASSGRPAWLWTLDGARIVWANPVGANLFGARSSAALGAKPFRPADPHRRQVARLAGQLPASGATRLERLRGFGAPLGALATCACSRLDFADGQAGILIVAAAPIGRAMPLIERLQRLVEGIDTPIASFAPDGLFVGASEAARALIGFRDLTDADLDAARKTALQSGRAELPIGIGHMVLQRVGSGADVALVALLAPGAAESEHLRPQVTLHADPEETPAQEANAPESPVAEIAAPVEAVEPIAAPEPAIELVSEPEPLAEPEPAAEPTQPTAATDVVAPPADYESPETTGEAPAEYTVIDDVAAQLGEHALVEPEPPEAEHDQATEFAQVGAEIVSPPPEELSAENIGEPPAPGIEPESPTTESESATATTAPSAELEPPASAWCDEPMAEPRRHPLRFTWQLDAEDRFSIGSDEFSRLIGPRTSAGFGRLWTEIAAVFELDPDGRFAEAIASRRTWSGITLQWPVDGPDQRLAVEMSGLPTQDRDGRYIGYRGFGVCRDLEGLTKLAALRRGDHADTPPRPLSADCPPAEAIATNPLSDIPQPSAAGEPSQLADPESNVETPHNVLPFRPTVDGRSPSLTPVENSAFNELARQLSARLESEALDFADGASEAVADETASPPSAPSPVNEQPDWLTPTIAPARGDSGRDRMLLDLVPAGVLIYRLDRMLYANSAFLDRMGFDSLHALEQAGGLDVLFVESEVGGSSSSSSETGAPITISSAPAANDPLRSPAAGRLHTITWDGEPSMALIFSETQAESRAEPRTVAHREADTEADADAELADETPSIDTSEASPVGHVNAEELAAILDTTTDGVVMFDTDGRLHACNRSAEALFGVSGDELMQNSLVELFALESQSALTDYFEAVKTANAASLLDHGRDLLGQVRDGGMIPLAVIIGRTSADGPNYFAVFRDLSQTKKTETELAQARRLAEHSASSKADVLARLSHEIRTPLNAILGFAEVMIEERLGALGNERYTEYMKDIRASGERVISVVNDLLDLSRIETGQLELAFAPLNLNEMVEQCVGQMQPQANRERIIIRTSLAHTLPPISADAVALRQIALNLIATSIQLANAGGQVIVSTALSDFGEVMLRVRDTGQRLNDDELAAAMQPFRSAPSDSATEASGVSLSLTKALVEANHAKFQIKTAPHSGTLIEVIFAPAHAQA